MKRWTVDSTVTELQRIIAALPSDSCGRLPSVAALSAQLHASPVTVWKAVRLLAERGAVQTLPGGGSVVTQVRPVPVARYQTLATSPQATGWKAARDRLEADIRLGRWGAAGKLPSVKILAASYGCNPATMRKVLGALQDRGAVHRHGRRRMISRSSSGSAASSTVVLVAQSSRFGDLAFMTGRSLELWRTLEHECLAANVRLEIISAEQALGEQPWDDGSILDLERVQRRRDIQGYLVLTVAMPNNTLGRLDELLLRCGRPAALLDEAEATRHAVTVSQSPRFMRLQVGVSSLEGRIAGSYLTAQGHRHVAFLSPYREDAGMNHRMAGFMEALALPGIDGRTLRVDLEQFPEEQALRQALAKSPRHAALLENVTAFERGIRVAAANSMNLIYNARTAIESTFLAEHYAPVLSRVLEDRRITAWAAYNDRLAFIALAFLRDRRVRVPADLSVVGFDDSLQAFSTGLTSYNFNLAGIVRTMLGHVLHPPGRIAHPHLVELPGMVIARQSSGPSRKMKG